MKLSRRPGLVLLVILGMASILEGCGSDGPTGTQDKVVVTPSAAGTVSVVSGGTKAVTLSFNSNDSNPVSDLTVTSGLSLLPAGWSGPSTFGCTTVKSGSGCVLTLTYAPTADASGALIIGYMYTNSAGAVESGAITVPYASTMHDTISATVSPSGQINAVAGASQAVTLTFTTDDGNPATALTVTDLAALPAGWRSAADSFSCAKISGGNGCLLPLTFAPSAAGDGTLTLSYSYTDDAGSPKTGSLNISYAATAHNNVVGTASPSGQVNAVVGSGAQPVSVNFTTDGGVASAFALTLGALPAGWTSTATSLTCATVSHSGSACRLPLSYAPATAGAGTLILNYSYINDAGNPATGTVSVPYASTVHDTVSGTVSPSGTVGATVGGTQAVTVTFTTSDGNSASGLAIASNGSGGLGSLPSGWSAAGSATTFACSSISTGAGCELNLTYAPTAIASGTITLDFSYIDNAGTAQTGTVSIAYAASAAPHAYISDRNNGLYMCSINVTTGTLSGCQTTGAGFSGAWSIAFYSGNTATYAYVVDGQRNNIHLCTVNADGTLSAGCTVQGGNYSYPEHLTVVGSTLYAADQGSPAGGEVTMCAINGTDGSLSGCIVTGSGSGLRYASGIALGGDFGFVPTDNNGLFTCAFDSMTGLLTNCAVAASSGSLNDAWNVVMSNGVAYFANAESGLTTCAVDGSGNLSSCSSTSLTSGFGPMATGVDLGGGWAYVSSWNEFGKSDVYLCPVDGLAVSACAVAVSDGSDSGFSALTDVIIH